MPHLTGNSNFSFARSRMRDGLGVIHPHELRIDDALQLGDDALLDALFEERHVVGALGENGLEDVLEQRLGERGVVGKVGERDFRFDHPELGEMPAGVGVLGAEGGAERIDLRQRHAVGLDVELSGDGEESLAAEEVLREIDLALRACEAGSSRSKVETRNSSPAPSASAAVMIGVLTQTNPCSLKKRWIAWAMVWRTRVTAPITFVRGRRCATSRRNSRVCGLG